MEEEAKDYITLFEAAKLCSYSEPYLRLRARQGKLKSIKLGSRWVTKACWIQDYESRVKEWNDKLEAKAALVSLARVENNSCRKGPEALAVAAQDGGVETLPSREEIAASAASVNAALDSAIEAAPKPCYRERRENEFSFALVSGIAFALLLFFGAAGNSSFGLGGLGAAANRLGQIGQANIQSAVENPGQEYENNASPGGPAASESSAANNNFADQAYAALMIAVNNAKAFFR